MIEDNGPRYVIRDQDEGIRPLDLLQAWGPPLRPPLRVRLARLLHRIAAWLDARGDSTGWSVADQSNPYPANTRTR